MKKFITILLSVGILFGVLYIPVSAQETNNSSTQELLQTLQGQIERLKTQIEVLITQIKSLRQAKLETKETVKEIKVSLKLIRRLRQGMTGEDVKLLQEMLATDSEIYPEGLITGFFGPLTERAVRKFQKKMGVEQVGVVGPKTLSKVNELLKEGAGSSGKVPPGLLISPGIRKKITFVPTPLSGQKLPPGISKKLGEEEEEEEEEEEDTTPPIISEVTATEITATSAKITWLTDEESDSNVWYDIVTPLVVDDETPIESFSDLTLNHNVELFDLTPNTAYYYLVSSTDSALNTATSSSDEVFNTLTEQEQACIDSGGEVSTLSCCKSTSDFPDLCVVGACGCSSENSHEVKICDCGTDKCFNGTECVAIIE